MAGFIKELKKLLNEAGCTFHREGRGDHEIWYSPITKRYFTLDHGTKSRHTANETLKQAGLPKAF
ncbi:type II toxin-antitoxin system HicA family toxin [Mariluticola halotolerans]|uniref:type II toxin-antitoxin system HicA family toxin n=1 Tax=Mariluticola halotolerans TaxID=2909283 RepID=UPI0026E21989|nr:type II toxin-antitoxin system HicA family toxin [Mariluticola halotolerans]UJQ95738.1 type II toxin-antitoxin system HicA family toxin [Mariluticola halotolerans]